MRILYVLRGFLCAPAVLYVQIQRGFIYRRLWRILYGFTVVLHSYLRRDFNRRRKSRQSTGVELATSKRLSSSST